MSVKFVFIFVTFVLYIFYDNTISVSTHSLHRNRGHRYQNQYYRHSHNHNHRLQQFESYQPPRANKRVRTGLDDLIDKLNVTDNYHVNDNNLDAILAADRFGKNDNESVTTERWKQSLIWPSETEKPYEGDGYDDVDDDTDDDDDDNDEEDEPAAPINFDTQADSENGYRGTLSERKWKTMSSRADLDKYFEAYKSGAHFRQPEKESSIDLSEALKHSMRMSREITCKVPRPKVIKVADHYPGTGKHYVPACTVLHQCNEDSGCCTDTQKCAPKKTQQVVLYFYAASYVYRGHNQRSATTVEKLKFFNHTECECIDHRDEEMPRDSEMPRELQRLNSPENNCRCPSEYTVRHLANGSCMCDCFDKQRDCIKYKKGREYFNHHDRLCIEMETCLQPSCDFGVYNRRSGRCPRKHEKLRTWSRFT
ncbi:uncharacterized protein LOC142326377 [Lycorma delicatula]|uniref:uncharacterized protein LOC142326377 n=1 Tax=Lycorma delicatula TaxID=130591 RepID=UPI003F50F413